MSFVAGIDPGNSGAVAVYCTDTRRIVHVEDLPFWYQTINKKKRKRIDPVALLELFDMLLLLGVELVVLEAVGGRPQQSASGAFVFGYTVGLIYMGCMYNKLYVDTVPPDRWKKMLNVSGKRGSKESKKRVAAMSEDTDDEIKAKKQAVRSAIKDAEGDIIKRVYEMFPEDRDLFRTPRGKFLMDRADAAMLAKFGGDFVLRTRASAPKTDPEFKLAYRNAETGA